MTQYTPGVDRRQAIINYISEYQQEHGYAPSITEISESTGTVRSNVHHHLNALRKEGRLTSHAHIARSWVVKQ